MNAWNSDQLSLLYWSGLCQGISKFHLLFLLSLIISFSCVLSIWKRISFWIANCSLSVLEPSKSMAIPAVVKIPDTCLEDWPLLPLDIETVVDGMRMPPIGSYAYIFSPQVAEKFGKNYKVFLLWRRCATTVGFDVSKDSTNLSTFYLWMRMQYLSCSCQRAFALLSWTLTLLIHKPS